MKIGVICALVVIALVTGQNGIHANSNHETPLRDVSPYKHLLRTRSIEDEILQICEPGSTRKEDCNNCFCIPDGSGWACTKMGCETIQIVVANPDDTTDASSNIQNDEQFSPNPEDESCDAGNTKKVLCNTCTCVNGRWACTEMGCL